MQLGLKTRYYDRERILKLAPMTPNHSNRWMRTCKSVMWQGSAGAPLAPIAITSPF